mmetsp:Transcript_463/g.868  ORF Transcript_463/g.868 Transcript_463/m.868 type:complete len:80 (+) Transcript_463:46-285(+)
MMKMRMPAQDQLPACWHVCPLLPATAIDAQSVQVRVDKKGGSSPPAPPAGDGNDEDDDDNEDAPQKCYLPPRPLCRIRW